MFRCKYCHNPDTIAINVEEGKKLNAEEIVTLANKQRSYFGKRGGVTFSGGEPLLQAKALIPVLQTLKAEGIHICLDTNGFFQTAEAKEALDLCDLILPDLKHIDPKKHLQLVGQSNENTLLTFDYLEQTKKPYRMRYVLVPGHTDDEQDLHKLGAYLKTRQVMGRCEILPYHNIGKFKREQLGWKYPLEGTPAASLADLTKAKEILSQYSDKIFIRG